MRGIAVGWRAVLAQLGAAALVAGLLKAGLVPVWSAPWLAALDGALALLLSRMLRLPVWWLPIQGLFVPALVLSSRWALPPGVWLAGFALLWLVFRATPGERVPLYLSNRRAWDAVAGLLPENQACSFVDLGCGLAGGLAHLAQRFPAGQFHGVEAAPLPWLLGWLRLRCRPNCHIRYGDFWAENLARYDLVYAFLSPEPMPELWTKARREMRPGSLLVSNSFAVPGINPDRILTLEDRRQTRLLIWRM